MSTKTNSVEVVRVIAALGVIAIHVFNLKLGKNAFSIGVKL